MGTLYLLPSLAYGLFMGLNHGSWALLWLSGASALIMAAVGQTRKLTEDSTLELRGWRVRVSGRLIIPLPWLWPRHLNDRILREVQQLSKESLAQAFDRELAAGGLMLGVTQQAKPVRLRFDRDGAHLLIIGPTGSGKTELMRILVQNWPERIIAVDFKGGLGLRGMHQVAELLTNDHPDPLDFWSKLGHELSRRERELAAHRAVEPILVLVDELGLVLQSSMHAQALLERIASKGRSLGVHLIAASQTLSGVPRALLANSGVRLLVGSVDPVDRAQLASGLPMSKPALAPGWAQLISASQQETFWFPFGRSYVSRVEAMQLTKTDYPDTAYRGKSGTAASVNPLLNLAGY